MATTREDLHRLVDALPNNTWAREAGRLALLYAQTGDPFYLSLLSAPVEDEDSTDEEIADIGLDEARVAHGDVVPDEDLPAALGWTN